VDSGLLQHPFADNDTARKVETQTPSITKRFEAMATLSNAGITTNVLIAPIIPGLNEQDIPAILQMARTAGASDATYTLLRLNHNVEPVFLDRMTKAFPDRIKKIVNRLQEVRGGTVSEQQFFKRHHGQGPTWQTIEQLFELTYRKEGFPRMPDRPLPQTFIRPGPAQQSIPF